MDINEIAWICERCAAKEGRWMNPEHVATWHKGVCNICRKVKSVTEPCDFGLTRDPSLPPTREEIVAMLQKLHPGKEVVFAQAPGIEAERRGVDAIYEILGITGVIVESDDTPIGALGTFEELAELPVPVTGDMTLLEALAKIRETYPAWPDTVQ